MFLRELAARIGSIKGAGEKVEEQLVNANINTVGDLLRHYPRDWQDRRRLIPLKDFSRYPAVCTVVQVTNHVWFDFRGNRTLKAEVEDKTGRAFLTCYSGKQVYTRKELAVGSYLRLWGAFSYRYGELQCSDFETEPCAGPEGENSAGLLSKSRFFGRIMPVYPLSKGITMNLIRRLMLNALEQYAGTIEDELPEEIILRDGLLRKPDALRGIHFPDSWEERDAALKILIYEELFYLEMMIGKRALERRSFSRRKDGGESAKGGTTLTSPASPEKTFPAPVRSSAAASPSIPAAPSADFTSFQKRLLERLPFTLTPGQIGAVQELNADMDGIYPMARLLQGDVGSGKTLVSFLAALKAIELGGQAALMAPTELLARQHAENAAKLLEPLGIQVCFLTGNLKTAGRRPLLKALAAGEIDFIIGTHALFSRDTVYRALRLVVIDEQHRFGVMQRQAVMDKGDHPDLLMMSATPIPRTLAFTVFGDLDVSVIRDMPPGRKPIVTYLKRESNAVEVYNYVRKELAKGRQAYFVYPLIEASEKVKTADILKDLYSMAERLAKEIFPPFTVALIHSKLEEEEKRQIMERFRKGEVHILAATSVVEVGVDVPNASCMVIEHAERFGLSALHQLRGRVGRGKDQAYCFLVYSDEYTDTAKQRLMVMLENTDGFVIAEEDLRLRGPGLITGTEQSGYLNLGLADPIRDALQLEQARKDAFAILERDPGLLLSEHQRVRKALQYGQSISAV
ncbi:MAG: ATP-dependent DNA helicase RecG [Treponema sp.]|jgi:ATP-dependent DNA helicase RecG|nr:ATP-dependent DNA helicase RecG [Treponema sp.]